MPAGGPLEPAGDGRPRWMAAGLQRRHPAPQVTESGVQVDSSVDHLVGLLIKAVTKAYALASMVAGGQHRSTFDALGTP
jgi:hypothetical protein